MTKEELLQLYPTKRIHPADGMIITANVWGEAHEYHRQRHQLDLALMKGAGIVAGLEVIASDPPDSSVYIMPGLALDARGNSVVLTEPVAFDLVSSMEGSFRVVLTYGESMPKADNAQEEEVYLRRVHCQFAMEVSTEPENFAEEGSAGIELARVQRQGRNSPIHDAIDALRPGFNEIDLRFRRHIGVQSRPHGSIALCRWGSEPLSLHSRGLFAAAQSFNYGGLGQVAVLDNISLTLPLDNHFLVCLAGQGPMDFGQEAARTLTNYVNNGGTLFVESCGRNSADDADMGVLDRLAGMGIRLAEAPADHFLLTQPYLFAEPPAGFETQGRSRLLVGDGVVYSSYNYGGLWSGQRRDRRASREEIRTAHEWAGNLIQYAFARHRNPRLY
jgi:hypothetical protein